MTITYDPTGNGIALPVVIVSGGGGGGGSTTSTVDTLYVVVVQFVDGLVTNNVGDYIQQIQVISSTGVVISTTWTNLTQGATLSTAPAPGYISATSANPLTDAQLRATPVVMSTAQLPPTIGPQTSSNSLSVYVANQSTLDNFPIVTQYVAKTASTGVAVGDYVQNLEIYDGGTDPATLISSAWTNITQGTTLAGPPPANTLIPLSGTGLTDAQLRATPVAVSATALPLPTDAATSALQTTGNSTLTTISGQIPTTLGTKTAANSLSVTLSSDGTVPLPTGAATSALQTTGNTSLDNIDTKTPALVSGAVPVTSTLLPASLGQKTMANSLAVVLSSDQSAIPVTIGAIPTTLFAAQQTVNFAATPLASNTMVNGVVIAADANNTGTIFVGPSTVTTSNGYPLVAGQAISYAVSNTNLIYIIGQNTTDKIAYTGN